MSSKNWNYTAAEKKAISAAWDEIMHLLDATDHRGQHRLRGALKIERRCRSCMMAAKALLVRGFAEGMRDNPTASTLADYSEGIATAVILGADHGLRRRGAVGRFDPTPADRDRLPGLLAAAGLAHDDYIRRGLVGI